LLKNFGSARMTGTGACVFLEVKSKQEADSVLAKLPADIQALVAKGINQSPLQKAIVS